MAKCISQVIQKIGVWLCDTWYGYVTVSVTMREEQHRLCTRMGEWRHQNARNGTCREPAAPPSGRQPERCTPEWPMRGDTAATKLAYNRAFNRRPLAPKARGRRPGPNASDPSPGRSAMGPSRALSARPEPGCAQRHPGDDPRYER